MLNDLSTFTRATIFGQLVPLGMLWGAIAGMDSSDPDVNRLVVIAGVSLLWMVGWGVFVAWVPGRAARRLHAEVERGSREIISGTTTAPIAPARVVRERRWKKNPPLALGAEEGRGAAAYSVAFTVLPPDGPPRRVATLSPVSLSKGTSALVALHPDLREVGVLDMRVTNAQVETSARDPRWRTDRLPTDRTVVGGYLMLVVALVAGIAAGFAIGWLLWLI
ncbi:MULTISPECIES: hypothetical protein [unclassified Nocardioides]|uniref:hypothetical protein n=1 Tax=unclassified Nocardioides TaxID=2615069 RepID=UPI0006F8D386|nr:MULTISPECIES: hypothetical protein [unclassified Nocardioides]KQY63940.1 hypothetical protein ASD30_02880 [Nocardioides sp. Root140]KRF15954.1 hypothetical protein ASH02_04885 [Nocardioides sp. Soil796]